MVNRRKFSSAFKAKVAMEALKERETLAELSHRFEVSQEMSVQGMRNMLINNPIVVNHKRIRRLMKLMDIKAIYPQKNLTVIAKNEYIYPYLLRHLDVTRMKISHNKFSKQN